MLPRNNPRAFSAALLLGTAILIGGCATTGMDRSVKTSHSIQQVDDEMRKMVVQIDATAASLDSLVRPGQPQVKKAFDIYSDTLARLDREGKKALKRVDEMKAHSKEYFEEWEKQGDDYKNPQIRELSEQRRSKLAGIYAEVPAAGSGMKGTYLAYLRDQKEIQLYLSNDLTPKGIETIAPVAGKSVQDLEALRSSLRPLIAALDEIKAELYGGKK